jgi:hypothetical protein
LARIEELYEYVAADPVPGSGGDELLAVVLPDQSGCDWDGGAARILQLSWWDRALIEDRLPRCLELALAWPHPVSHIEQVYEQAAG